MAPDLDPRVVRTRNDVLEASIDVLINQGWDAVTQPNVARAAGYSKATVYAHWPERLDLLRDTFARYGDIPHHDRTGDLRTDLTGEMRTFRAAMVDHRLDRVLAVLAERSSVLPETAEIRERFVEAGEGPMRSMLKNVPRGPRREAAVLMLCGLVTHSVLMHGEPPSDRVIDAAVDMVLRGLDATS
jgi:AcrR family transcriptional regulator